MNRILNLSILTIAFVATCLNPAISQIVNTPIAHYKFDEKSGIIASDSSGNNINATITGTEKWVDGYLGGALEFDASTYVALPVDGLELTSATGSVSAWAYSYVNGRIRSIFAGGDNNTGGGFGPENEMHLILEPQENNIWAGGELTFYGHSQALSSKMFFIWSDADKGLDNAAVPPVNPISLDDNKWHHVVSTWGDGKAAIYIDSALVAEISYTNPSTAYKFKYFNIGSMLDGGNRKFNGKLDDVRIYNGVLSAEEVAQLYKNDFEEEEPEPVIISGLKTSDISIFPNPANDFITLQFPAIVALSNPEIQIMSMDGKLMKTATSRNAEKLNIDISHFEKGMYLLKVKSMHDMTSQVFIKK